jgi:NAD kinase
VEFVKIVFWIVGDGVLVTTPLGNAYASPLSGSVD